MAQIEVVAGRPDLNVTRMLERVDEAKEQGVNLIAFPEMCVGGYLVGDKWLEDSFCMDLMGYNAEIIIASEGIAIAWGNIYVDPNEAINKRVNDTKGWHPNKDGRPRKYNAINIVQDGVPLRKSVESSILPRGVLPKTLLPNYRFFDDERYFFSLERIAEDFGVSLEELLQPFLVEFDGTKVPIGFELCEDLWCADYRKNLESVNPSGILVKNKAQLIINLSASPWTFGKNGARDRRVEYIAKAISDDFVPFLYVNCTGAQNNGKNIVTFDGGSTVYNNRGEPVILSKEAYKEETIIVTPPDFTKSSTVRKEESKIAQKYHAIIRGIRHMKDIFGWQNQPKYIIGLSGGVDSAVVAALLTLAVGPGNILAVNMPSVYNSDATKQAAGYIAEQLGIRQRIAPIGNIIEAVNAALEGVIQDEQISDVQMGNVHAKIRATDILSNLAGHYGAIFTNNGNKVEIATGYTTLYGDVGGAIAPIGDLLKVEVFELARYLNEHVFKKEVIPESLLPDELYHFKIPPTAELEEKQVDPFKWGYHDAVLEAFTDFRKKSPEDVMNWYLEGSLEKNLGVSNELIKRWDIHNPKEFVRDLEWFYKKIQQNIFKRVQAPPIIILSKSAYGYDIRESQMPYVSTRAFDRMKEKVLHLEVYQPK